MTYRNIISAIFAAIFFFLSAAVTLNARAATKPVHFIHAAGATGGLSERSLHRVERFLAHVFPRRRLAQVARIERDRIAPEVAERSITYHIISQEGLKFVLAAYSLHGSSPIHELAIYRLEHAGPNEVWRSKPWAGSFSDLHFSSAKSQSRTILLFQEGGNAAQDGHADQNGTNEFALASIFTFLNKPDGVFLHDLTPELPWLRARARFPLRALYAERISLQNETSDVVVLRASDEEFNRGMAERIRPERAWKYNPHLNRFERMNPIAPAGTEARNVE